MRRIFILTATAVSAMAVSSGTAMAAGQQVCIGGPSSTVSTPNSGGTCKKGFTLTTLALESDVTTLQGQVSTLQGQVSSLQSDNTTLKSEVSTLQGQVSSLQSDNTTLKSGVSDLQAKLSKVSYSDTGLNGLPTLQVSGANLQIVSGSGSTAGTPNGLGNLIIGYDENSTGVSQTGSHNLVVGREQKFTAFGDVIGGEFNSVTAPFAHVFGNSNTASATGASVNGGATNTASGIWSSILGGNGITLRENFGTSP